MQAVAPSDGADLENDTENRTKKTVNSEMSETQQNLRVLAHLRGELRGLNRRV